MAATTAAAITYLKSLVLFQNQCTFLYGVETDFLIIGINMPAKFAKLLLIPLSQIQTTKVREHKYLIY